jgi:hypothetical protein
MEPFVLWAVSYAKAKVAFFQASRSTKRGYDCCCCRYCYGLQRAVKCLAK